MSSALILALLAVRDSGDANADAHTVEFARAQGHIIHVGGRWHLTARGESFLKMAGH